MCCKIKENLLNDSTCKNLLQMNKSLMCHSPSLGLHRHSTSWLEVDVMPQEPSLLQQNDCDPNAEAHSVPNTKTGWYYSKENSSWCPLKTGEIVAFWETSTTQFMWPTSHMMLAKLGINAVAPIATWPHAHTTEGLRKTPQLQPVSHLHSTFRYPGLSGLNGGHRGGTVVPPPLLFLKCLGLC